MGSLQASSLGVKRACSQANPWVVIIIDRLLLDFNPFCLILFFQGPLVVIVIIYYDNYIDSSEKHNH